MGLIKKKDASPKFRCKECDAEFESEEKLNLHLKNHISEVYCDSCPIDMAVQKFVKLFKGRK
jgi:predicted SprT family Zn-dependent metalloprotease